MLANLEIHWVVEEMKSLEGGWFQKFWDLGEGYKMRINAERPVDIVINPPEYVYMTKYRIPSVEPKAMTMKIRKELHRARLVLVTQPNFDRIVEFRFDNGYRLVVELFSKGNLILVSPDGKTVVARRYEEWKDRAIKPGVEYRYPRSDSLDPRTMSLEEFSKIFVEKDIIRSLVKHVKLGNIYLEEACRLSGEDKNAEKPQDLEKLYNTIKGMLQLKEPCLVDIPRVIPINGECKKKFKSFNEALDEFYTKGREAKPRENEKLEKLKRILEEQERSLKELEEKAEEYKKIGDAIYANYNKLNEILGRIRELRSKNVDWREIEKLLGVKIDEKKGKVYVDV